MATKNEEIRAINRVAKILDEISVENRTYVLSFLRGIHGSSTAAKAPSRIEAALEALDVPARSRVVKLFVEQVAVAYANEDGGATAES